MTCIQKIIYQKLESIQFNAALAITGARRGTSREKLYHELGLESLQERRFLFLKNILKGQSSDFFPKIRSSIRRLYNTRKVDYISYFNTKHDFFRNFFFHQPQMDGII